MVCSGGEEMFRDSHPLRITLRWIGRFAIVAVAIALVTAATWSSGAAGSRTRVRERRGYRRRALEPQPGRIASFAGEFAIIGMITLAGRKILRLRL
jgi:hypothetical protein